MDIEVVKTDKPISSKKLDNLIKNMIVDHPKYSDKLITSRLEEIKEISFNLGKNKEGEYYRKLIKEREEIQNYEKIDNQWDSEKVYPKNGFTIAD